MVVLIERTDLGRVKERNQSRADARTIRTSAYAVGAPNRVGDSKSTLRGKDDSLDRPSTATVH
jgi:hypothetical protein